MSFTDSVEHATQAHPYKGAIPLTHRYTAGVAGEKFLRALKQGKLLGTTCPTCDYTYVPARMYCERCMDELDESTWVEVGPEGELVSYTGVAVDLDGNHLAEPRWVGLVRLDGASGVLVHDLDVSDPEALRAGMRVKAVLKPATQRRGSITDIRGFKPV